MQENKPCILSTRPLDPLWVARAADRGILLEAVSFIETEALHNKEIENVITSLYGKPVTVIFTSMNAVEAVAMYMEALHARGKRHCWRIFCIGQATQRLVTGHFGETAIAGTADSALGLADAVLKEGNTMEAFFFCGDRRRDELPDRLREEGIRVTEIVVYQTKQTACKLEKQYQGILFFSPSAVHSFFSVNNPEGKTVLFAIGSTTAAAIGSYSDNAVILSASPGKEELVQQAIEFFTGFESGRV